MRVLHSGSPPPYLDRLSDPPEVYVTLTAMLELGAGRLVEVVNTRYGVTENFSEIISWFLL